MQEGRWDDAAVVLENLMQAGQNDPETVQRLGFARAQQQRAGLIAEARRLYAAKQWAEVLSVTEQLARLGARTKETDRLAATARTKLEKSNREQARRRAREEAQAAGVPAAAELPTRFVARLIDLGVYLIPLVVLTPTTTGETSTELTTSDTLRLGGIVLTIAIYEVLLTRFLGGTLGKRLFRLRVVRADDGSPVGWHDRAAGTTVVKLPPTKPAPPH